MFPGAKTCGRGHLQTMLNTYVWTRPDGTRKSFCRECQRLLNRTRHDHKEIDFIYKKGFCRKGHEMTPENTESTGNGNRRCKTCRQDREARSS